MTAIKSIHIKEFWPYEYVKPDREAMSAGRKERQNELRRARYAKAKAIKTPKRQGSKKLLGLKVFELDIDFCGELNRESQSRG